MDWYTAQKDCKALNKDAKLAEMKSKEENDFIKCKLFIIQTIFLLKTIC